MWDGTRWHGHGLARPQFFKNMLHLNSLWLRVQVLRFTHAWGLMMNASAVDTVGRRGNPTRTDTPPPPPLLLLLLLLRPC